jgi:hypothetical protein
MNKIRTILESPFGAFLVDGIHDGGKVQSLAVHPVNLGIVGPSICQDKSNWQELIEKLENLLKS